MRPREHPYTQHIGDSDGRICVWLNETGAIDVASAFAHDDRFHIELMQAVERAYPREACEYHDPLYVRGCSACEALNS